MSLEIRTNPVSAALPPRYDDNSLINVVRFVVMDTETTGTNPARDKLITIGAVAVYDGEICLDDIFEVMAKIDYNLSAVTVHGITRDEARAGIDESEAVSGFIRYVDTAVIVGHHIGFDLEVLNLACEKHHGCQLNSHVLDTMDLTLHLQAIGAFAHQKFTSFSLDALCEVFHVAPRDRHTAAGDAFITAQVFIRLLKIARKAGLTKLGDLTATANRA